MQNNPEDLGRHVIRALHLMSSDMDPEDAFNFRMEFYTKLFTSDLTLCVSPSHIREALDMLVERSLEIYNLVQEKEPRH